MKFTRKSYGRLLRADGTQVSQHTVAEEAYERAAVSGAGTYTYIPPIVQIDVPAAPAPAPAPVPAPVPAPAPVPTPAPAPAPAGRLLQKSDLRYMGAFKVPAGIGDNTFEWGGTALGLGPSGRSLYLTGHDHQQRSAEISIPEVRTSGYATASLLQSWRDATEGKLGQFAPGTSDGVKIGGHLVYGGKLYITGWAYYDSGDQQRASIIERPLSLSDTGKIVGPVAVPGVRQRFMAGYMCPIPAAWQGALGGPVLAGLPNPPIIGNGSGGPTAIVFDPANLSKTAIPLLAFPHPSDLATLYGYQANSGTNPVWNWLSLPRGCVFPDGTDSVLFVGSHGAGEMYYGGGERDPANPYYGSHAYPYVFQVWAYDANDLAKVRRGEAQMDKIKPYSYWTFELPNDPGRTDVKCGGAAFDAQTRRIYVSALRCDGDAPLIHVFEV